MCIAYPGVRYCVKAEVQQLAQHIRLTTPRVLKVARVVQLLAKYIAFQSIGFFFKVESKACTPLEVYVGSVGPGVPWDPVTEYRVVPVHR